MLNAISFKSDLTKEFNLMPFRILPKNNQSGFDFLSNDYLGLAKFDQGHFSEEVQSFYGGSTGSRLLSGNQQIHESFESYIATFFNVEAALLFNSGYDANIGLFLLCFKKETCIAMTNLFTLPLEME